MQKFDPQAFLSNLKEEAANLGLDFSLFFNAIRVELNRNRPDKKQCLRLAQLVGFDISLSQETINHIPDC